MKFPQWFALIAVTVIFSCLVVPRDATADMEGQMPFSRIQYESIGVDNFGPVKIDFSQDKDGVHDAKIFAFGTIHLMTKDQLKIINGYMFNAVGLSYSMGYHDNGGKTVYILLYKTFSSGPQVAAMVVIREHANAKVVIIKDH